MISPLTSPAPILSMRANPAKTATAPVSPANGAHHCIVPIPSIVGSGRGRGQLKVCNFLRRSRLQVPNKIPKSGV